MSPPVGLDRVSGKVFIDHGDAYSDEFDGKTGAGAELIVDVVFGYTALIPVIIGYANGLSEGGIDAFYIRVNGLF